LAVDAADVFLADDLAVHATKRSLTTAAGGKRLVDKRLWTTYSTVSVPSILNLGVKWRWLCQ